MGKQKSDRKAREADKIRKRRNRELAKKGSESISKVVNQDTDNSNMVASGSIQSVKQLDESESVRDIAAMSSEQSLHKKCRTVNSEAGVSSDKSKTFIGSDQSGTVRDILAISSEQSFNTKCPTVYSETSVSSDKNETFIGSDQSGTVTNKSVISSEQSFELQHLTVNNEAGVSSDKKETFIGSDQSGTIRNTSVISSEQSLHTKCRIVNNETGVNSDKNQNVKGQDQSGTVRDTSGISKEQFLPTKCLTLYSETGFSSDKNETFIGSDQSGTVRDISVISSEQSLHTKCKTVYSETRVCSDKSETFIGSNQSGTVGDISVVSSEQPFHTKCQTLDSETGVSSYKSQSAKGSDQSGTVRDISVISREKSLHTKCRTLYSEAGVSSDKSETFIGSDQSGTVRDISVVSSEQSLHSECHTVNSEIGVSRGKQQTVRSGQSGTVRDISVISNEQSLHKKCPTVNSETGVSSDKSPSVIGLDTRSTNLENRRIAYRKRYQEDAEFREKKKAAARQKYKDNQYHKITKNEASKAKYATEPAYKQSIKEASKQKYATDHKHQTAVKELMKRKYAVDLEYREAIKESSKRKYAVNLEHRDSVRKSSKRKYAVDFNHQETVKKSSKRKYAEDIQHRETLKESSKRKYQTDSEFREQLKKTVKKKYNEDKQYKDKVIRRKRLKYRQSETHRQQKLSVLRSRYKCNQELKQKKTEKKNVTIETDDVISSFRKEISKKPKYICCVCHKFLWQHQCIVCHPEQYCEKASDSGKMAKECITSKYVHQCTDSCPDICENAFSYRGKYWICFTCNRKLLKGEMPVDAHCNGLELPPIPEELDNLNDLEKHLLALRIPFMKVISLPKGGQKGVIGPCVSVPTDVQQTTKTLPRSDNDSKLIRVKLKRKLTYKGHYKYQFVNSKKLKLAFNYLKDNNRWYSDVTLDPTWENPIEKVLQSDESAISEDESSDDESRDESNANKTEVKGENDKMQGVPIDTCLQPDDIGQEVLDQYFEDIFCVAPAENSTPVSMLKEVGNEAMSFPGLFPDGSASFSDDRSVPITPLRYFHNRLMNADTRFAMNNSYIFYAQYLSELQQVISGVSIALRKGTASDNLGGKISAGMITDKTSLKKLLTTDQGYKFLKPVRGTPPYWQTTMKDLFAMIRQKGIPTWFCSFSAADMRWSEIIDTILEQQGRPQTAEDLDWTQKCEVLSSNAVMNALMFNHRFHAFLKMVILSDLHPIGNIDNRFHRVEFQKRGSPHTHCVFWVQDSPKLDKDDDETVCQFIDKYVSCQLPSEEEDSELSEIVSSVQRHSSAHSKSCKKKGTTCRFNFPRPPSERTFISRPASLTDPSSDRSPEQELNDAKQILKAIWDIILNPELDPADINTKSLFLQAGVTQEQYEHASDVMTKRASVVLKRSPADVWINQYNPTLVRSWNANMDIQFILDAYSCVMYIISYISKAERELGLVLEETRKEAVEGNLDAEAAMKKIGSSYFHQREVCVQEAVYRVCGLHLKECSCMVQFLPVGENPVRMTKPLNLIQTKSQSLDDEDIWMSSLSDKYKVRPTGQKFDTQCYASFCSEFRILSPSQIPEKPSRSVYQLQNNLGFIQQRTRTQAAVVRYPRFSLEKNPESYYQSILQLFLPYRTDQQLRPKSFRTYEEFYKLGTVKLIASAELTPVSSIVNENLALFEKDAQILDDAKDLMERCGPLEDAWASLASETEKERLECEIEMKNHAISEEDGLEADVPELSKTRKEKGNMEIIKTVFKSENMLPLMRSMNAKQKEVFYFVRQWCIDRANGKEQNPFHLFITGGAGTGKSHLVKCLYFEVNRLLSPLAPNPDDIVALLTAPTGTAAFNIGGTTIHSAFSLSKCLSLPYQALKDDSISTLRSQLQYLQILFIDEISMVDQKLLIYISERLRQIKVTKSKQVPFGNICVIAVGDFYQLPPVRQATLLKRNAKYPVNLFTDYFHLVELDEIMRQREDVEFAAMLNRLRVRKRKEPLQQSDINQLEQCQLNYQKTTALHVFSTNAEVDAHNYNMARKVCDVAMNIMAQDFKKNLTTGKLEPVDTDRNCPHNSLPADLFIGKGARVMLTRNLDVGDGLVNGVFGTVKDILPRKDEYSLQKGILVKFDDNIVGLKLRKSYQSQNASTDLVMITPVTEDLDTRNKVRHQFPLQLAWACTVHKVQGTTTDAITASLNKIFSPGQAYVALSRCTSLKGLMIKDLDISKIYCDENVGSGLEKLHRFQACTSKTVVPNSCSLLLHNIQGLYPHFKDLTSNTEVNCEFICLTETWLNPTDMPPSFPNYTFHHKPRSLSYNMATNLFKQLKQQSHGGVGIFIHKTSEFSLIDLGVLNIEYMAIHIHKCDLAVVLIYRAETYPATEFLKNLNTLIQELANHHKSAILIGDFNENLFKSTRPIHEFLYQSEYQQLVTHATTDGGTLIDHVYSNTNFQIDTCIIPTYYSYHNMVSIDLGQKGQ